jgi:integral membrane protein (TIGR01906 family)
VRRRAPIALTIALALLVPPILVTNGIRVLANDWFVRFEYARLPPDPYGLSRAQRTELGLTGLHSILPRNGEGIALLRRARLATGRAAFREKELRHMADVRRLFGVIYPAHLAAVAAVAVLALGLAVAGRGRRLVGRAFTYGAGLTLVLAAGVAVALAVSADAFLNGFHWVFFEGRSWRFRDDDTLRRLYPDRFWTETAVILGLGAAAQAGLLLLAARRWLAPRSRWSLSRPLGWSAQTDREQSPRS